MFELAWSEMLVIAIVLIVVVGPKDLPKMLRTFGKFAGKMSSMAGDFRKQFDEAMKEADLDDVRKSVDDLRSLNPKNQIRQALSPMEKAAADVRSGVDSIMRPKTSVPTPPASTEATAAEPLKTGPTAEPNGTAVPAMPAPQPPAASVTPAAVAPFVAAPAPVAAPKKPRATKAKAEAAVVATAVAAKPAAAKAVAKPTASAKPAAAPKAVAKAPAAKSAMNGTPVDKPARTRKPKETGSPT